MLLEQHRDAYNVGSAFCAGKGKIMKRVLFRRGGIIRGRTAAMVFVGGKSFDLEKKMFMMMLTNMDFAITFLSAASADDAV